ncbi:Integrase [Vibrio crassostreae]|nr:Integrase [Vibrio crassostreae]
MNVVKPVTTPQARAELHSLLVSMSNGNMLYADIWKVGVNLALRISDLLSIKMSDVVPRNGAVQDMLVLSEGKTGKTRVLVINDAAKDVIQRRYKANPDHEWLFQAVSNRSRGKAVSRQAVTLRFSEIGARMGIQINTHSMRKTRGYAMFTSGVPIERIQKMLNHSSAATTLVYIGIDEERVNQDYAEFQL